MRARRSESARVTPTRLSLYFSFRRRSLRGPRRKYTGTPKKGSSTKPKIHASVATGDRRSSRMNTTSPTIQAVSPIARIDFQGSSPVGIARAYTVRPRARLVAWREAYRVDAKSSRASAPASATSARLPSSNAFSEDTRKGGERLCAARPRFTGMCETRETGSEQASKIDGSNLARRHDVFDRSVGSHRFAADLQRNWSRKRHPNVGGEPIVHPLERVLSMP